MNVFIRLIIGIVVCVLVVMVAIWLLRYMEAPRIIEKVVVVLAVLGLLVYALQSWRSSGGGDPL